MSNTQPKQQPKPKSAQGSRFGDRLLTLRSLLDDLQVDGLLNPGDVLRLTGQSRSKAETEQHPLGYIASQQLANQRSSGQKLTMPDLLQWLGEKSQQPVAHIDPMKIEVRSVTAVMSFALSLIHI